MSLHKDFKPIRGQLLNCSSHPFLDTTMNELVREEVHLATLQAQNEPKVLAITTSAPPIKQPQQSGDSSGSSNRHKQTNKKFCNYYKHPGHTIETCYRRNKSTAVVAHTESTPPMPSISTESQPSLFSKLDPAPHPLNIHIADGSIMHENSLGFVSTSNPFVPGVFQVPDLSYNLCSVGQLAELGYRLIFYYFGCIVQDPRTR